MRAKSIGSLLSNLSTEISVINFDYRRSSDHAGAERYYLFAWDEKGYVPR